MRRQTRVHFQVARTRDYEPPADYLVHGDGKTVQAWVFLTGYYFVWDSNSAGWIHSQILCTSPLCFAKISRDTARSGGTLVIQHALQYRSVIAHFCTYGPNSDASRCDISISNLTRHRSGYCISLLENHSDIDIISASRLPSYTGHQCTALVVNKFLLLLIASSLSIHSAKINSTHTKKHETS